MDSIIQGALVAGTVLGGVGTVAAAVIAYLQHKGKKVAEARAERMAEELTQTREELALSRQAQERLATIQGSAIDAERRIARDAASAQRRRERAEDSAARREERNRKRFEQKMLAEEKKQTKAAEKLAKEARRRKK